MAFGVLTTNSVEEALERAGDGSVEQGVGGGGRGDRDGARHRGLEHRPRHGPGRGECRGASRAREQDRAAPRARSGAADPLSVGGRPDATSSRPSRRSSTCSGRTPSAAARRPARVRFRAGARHGRAARGDRSADRRDGRALAARADGGPRSADPADGALRAAARPGTPPAVVINEALELARTFSTEESVKFINGMLDGDSERRSRHAETGARPRLTHVLTRRTDCSSAARTSTSSRSSASTSTRTGSSAATPCRELVGRMRRPHARRARSRAPPRPSRAGASSAIRSFGKANFLVDLRRPREDPGLRPAGLAAGARLSDLQAARFRRLGRRRGPPVPDEDQRADDLGVAAALPGQVPAAAAREVARADRRRDPLPAAVPRSHRQPRRRGGCSRPAAA